MKLLLVFLMLAALSACGTAHVRVKNCQDLQGMDGEKNCELIQKL